MTWVNSTHTTEKEQACQDHAHTYAHTNTHSTNMLLAHSEVGKLDSYNRKRASLSRSPISGYCSHTSDSLPEEEGALDEMRRSLGTDIITYVHVCVCVCVCLGVYVCMSMCVYVEEPWMR